MLKDIAKIMEEASHLHTPLGYRVRMINSRLVLHNDHTTQLCEAEQEYFLSENIAFNLVNDGHAVLVRGE
jgi:hypothetical protein